MSEVMLTADGLLSKQQVIEDFGIPESLQPNLFAVLKPKVGKLFSEKDVETALEKALAVSWRPFVEGEVPYGREGSLYGVAEISGPDGPWDRIANSLEQVVRRLLPQDEPAKAVNVMLTPAEAARQMKLNVQTVRAYCRQGSLGIKAGRKWLISPDEVKQYLRGQLLINGRVAE